MIVVSLRHEWSDSSMTITTSSGSIQCRGVQSASTLNSAPWGKSQICKQLCVVDGDDISVAILFMESRDVITVAAESIEVAPTLSLALGAAFRR